MKFHPKYLLFGAIFVALILGYYYYLTNRNVKTVEDQSDLSEVEKVITENLDKNYPATPREVVKFYTTIQQCYYNEDYSEKQLEQMAEQAEKLFDEELVQNNPIDQYLRSLRTEIAAWRNDGKTLNVTLPDSKDVKYEEVNGRDSASLICIYYVRQGASYEASQQAFVLRKDEDGRWKILGWTLVTPSEEGQNS